MCCVIIDRVTSEFFNRDSRRDNGGVNTYPEVYVISE